MEIFFIKLIQLVLAITLLVFLHEGGHMIASKLFGIRVEKFFIFFDLGVGKWSGKLFSFKPRNSDTEYGMGWLPLGGYCKIAGMVDESFDTEQMQQPAQDWEFRSKPAWQRLIVMIGGVTVNFLLALFIYSMIMFHWGESYVRLEDMSQGMKFNTEAKQYGFRDHDILVGTDRGAFKDLTVDVYRDLSEARYCDVVRGGKKVRIDLPGDINLLGMLKNTPAFMSPFVPAVIDSVFRDVPVADDATRTVPSPAAALHLAKGDTLLAVNGKAVDSYNEFTDEIGRVADQMTEAKTAADSLRLRRVSLVVAKAGGSHDTLQATLTADLKVGFTVKNVYGLYQDRTTHVSYGFWQSFPAGVKYGWDVLAGYVSDMQYVFTADGAKSLGGFGAIGSLFPATWDWYLFWKMTAFLSIILAFMNILPIPALDGGHVLFLLYEIIARRKPSDTFMVRAEYAGVAILVVLMVVANLNDILRWLGIM